MKKPAPQTITFVTWDDAWQDQENFVTAHGMRSTHEPMVVVTKGTIVVDDERGISMANEESAQDGHTVYRGRTFIPREMIRSVETFNLVKPKKKKPETDVPGSEHTSEAPAA